MSRILFGAARRLAQQPRLVRLLAPPRALSVGFAPALTVGAYIHTTPVAAGPVLSSPSDIAAVKSSSVLIDLRSESERQEVPGPSDALVWDFNADATVPSASLPTDLSTPIILY